MKQVEHEFREDRGQRRHRRRCGDEHKDPAEYEGRGIAVRLAQKHVHPAVRGSIELSSATVSAPQILMMPNATHSAMMMGALGTRPAIVGGVRKMPLPMVMPTMSAVPLEKPMTLRRSCVTGVEVGCSIQCGGHPTHLAGGNGTG